MTQDEFQQQYHEYQTSDAKVAQGATVVPVSFGALGWCLMLQDAAEFITEHGVAVAIGSSAP